MEKELLTISGHGKTWQVELDAKGTIIGRSPQCDVVLESKDISRKHARIFQDPFNRWIVEDLGSHNGTFVNDKPVEAYAVLPGESIGIGIFTLSIELPLSQQIKGDSSLQMTTSVKIDGFEPEITPSKSKADETLSRPYLRQLNEINECLSKLTSPSALYPAVCRCLAQTPRTVAAVLRLPENAESPEKSPDILACHFGGNLEEPTTQDVANLCLSRRVLEAVRSSGNATMAKSAHSLDGEMALTLSDEHSPRAVICAPLSPATDVVDLLYLDIPVDKTAANIFEFVQAVSGEVILTRKSLISMQMKAERQILDQQLSLAHDIQSKLTPSGLEHGFAVDVAVCYEPAMWVGGDYYDVWSLENGQIAFAVGDVSGKGLPAAMIMSNLQAALRTTMTFCTELSTVVEHVNRHLCKNLREDMFVTLFLGLFDPSKNELAYVNAGHILPIIMRPSEHPQPLGKATHPPLGIVESPFEMALEKIQPDTTLLVVTDGVTETVSPDGNFFEMDRLVKLMADSEVHSAHDLVRAVTKDAGNFRQTLPQQDDITVFALVNRKVGSNKKM
ncbi:MAG: SpoIIE family protein phosphatase [Planctomycetota bacterium]|jgi:serine phosphatase RsbU (regulator of sigma subunit)/pSer/pThr/pTyr-binding forkhead associated (FHA) protein